MRRISSVLAVIALTCVAILPLVAAPASATTKPPTGVPTSVAACRHGGWRTLSDPVGAPFGSRAACFRWADAHPGGQLGLRDLVGSFAGTQSFSFECSFIHQVFNAGLATPVKSRVGPATLVIEGCINGGISTFDGTFSITTSSGTVSGSVTGTLAGSFNNPSYSFHLALSATTANGLFTGVTGALVVEIAWPGYTEISGTVAIPAAI